MGICPAHGHPTIFALGYHVAARASARTSGALPIPYRHMIKSCHAFTPRGPSTFFHIPLPSPPSRFHHFATRRPFFRPHTLLLLSSTTTSSIYLFFFYFRTADTITSITMEDAYHQRIDRTMAAENMVRETVQEEMLRARANRPRQTILTYEPKIKHWEVCVINPQSYVSVPSSKADYSMMCSLLMRSAHGYI